jgi:hypothetical protein
VRFSALRAGHPSPPGRFLVLISVRGSVDPRAIVRPEGLGKFKIIHLIWTRTRDLPACSIVPWATKTCPCTATFEFLLCLIFRLVNNAVSVVQLIQCQMGRQNDRMVCIWNMAFVACFRALQRHSPEETEENQDNSGLRMVFNPARIRTGYLWTADHSDRAV